MDYYIEIEIAEKDLFRAGIKEIKFYWGGEEFSHTPRRFETEDSLIMNEFPKSGSNIKFVNIKEVYNLRDIANWCPDKLSSNNLMKLLKKVSTLKKFTIILCGDDETIDYSIKYNGNPDISEIIYNALINEKSIVIYK